MNTVIDETEEQAFARIRETRARRALTSAADLAIHVRGIAINGKTETGETLREWSAPMRITAVDDLDAVYVQLVEWVMFWAETLDIRPPATAPVAWRNFQHSHPSTGNQDAEIAGLKAGTSPEGAHLLVSMLTMWLILREERIHDHESAAAYQDDVVQMIGGLRGRYPTAPRPPKPVSSRPCPVCGVEAVGAEWSSPDVTDVVVSCAHCGETFSTKPSDLVRWLS